MTRRSKADNRTTMLELWRPPRGAGDPVGCLATTYTFQPALFDEQCLARFLGIQSDPDREDTAFLLEREHRLGSTYAGVLVDHTQAGVEHSLRWDVLAVRVPRGKQHAKVSVLAWAQCVRVIIASANLTEPGYRLNFEVASSIDFRAEECDTPLLRSVLDFMESLLGFVPMGTDRPDLRRARDFLARVRGMSGTWKDPPRSRTIRHLLACTLPGPARSARSALDELIAACRSRGASPHLARVASPFFDDDPAPNRAADALCRQMARGRQRTIDFCVPGSKGTSRTAPPRLFAPRSLFDTSNEHGAGATMYLVPSADGADERPWHAKMMCCIGDTYSGLMVGSSNFTAAGLGLIPTRNAEANLVTLIDYQHHGREEGLLHRIWADMDEVPDASKAEWSGPQASTDDEDAGLPLPAGFLSAQYRCGNPSRLVIQVERDALPEEWAITAEGRSTAGGEGPGRPVIRSHDWGASGRPPRIDIEWSAPEPPELLRVAWGPHSAFLPLNVDDARTLPPPPALRDMTAEEMLTIIAATDPGAAMRAWERRRRTGAIETFDPDLDAATPAELDPLRRHSLAETFLHRVRRRARIMLQLRQFIERPASSTQALEWRLRGLIGVEPLAHRFAAEFEAAGASPTNTTDPREALLTLADLLMVLRGATYIAEEGAIPRSSFERIYRPFLRELAKQLEHSVRVRRDVLPADLAGFWDRTVRECGA